MQVLNDLLSVQLFSKRGPYGNAFTKPIFPLFIVVPSHTAVVVSAQSSWLPVALCIKHSCARFALALAWV